jgi:hypothetical protein
MAAIATQVESKANEINGVTFCGVWNGLNLSGLNKVFNDIYWSRTDFDALCVTILRGMTKPFAYAAAVLKWQMKFLAAFAGNLLCFSFGSLDRLSCFPQFAYGSAA